MTQERTVPVWQGKISLRVRCDGSGPPLVFFHGPWGLTKDPFIDALARDFSVYAPEHPGTTPGAPDDVYQLDGLWDLVVCYDEMLDALTLDQVVVVGHSFGGMVACEVAAASPKRVRSLVLIDPIGFWRDAEPVVNWMSLDLPEMRRRIFREPDGAAAQQLFGQGEEAADRVRLAWAMGATGKFIWPIPDKGLKKRIHRVTAPTLLVWGKEDRLVPPVYADEFSRRLPGARLQTVDQAGHAPHLEQPEAVARMVREFAKP
jgi:pimeloyl-ACP methyl ester carboxylesterase